MVRDCLSVVVLKFAVDITGGNTTPVLKRCSTDVSGTEEPGAADSRRVSLPLAKHKPV